MGRTGFIRDQLDIRILVLYLMSRVAAPVDFVTLADMAFCDDGVTYFEFAEAVNRLVELEQLTMEGLCVGRQLYPASPASSRICY